MKTLIKSMLISIICLSAAPAISGQKRNHTVSLDTSCVSSQYPAFGLHNLQEGQFVWMNRKPEEMDSEENSLKFFSIDTISFLEFKKEKATYKSFLNADSSLVEWTDTSFMIHNCHFKADSRDYSDFNYYLGYLAPLQLYCISSVNSDNEIGFLTFIDKLTGKTFFLESPSDFPLDAPAISKDTTFFSAYVNDNFSNYTFVSFFKINKQEHKFCFEDYSGLKISNSRIDDCVWVNSSSLALLITDITNYSESAIQYCLRITIKTPN